MKKFIATMALSAALLGACGNGDTKEEETNNTFTKAVEQGKLALADHNLSKALSSFELAHQEKPDDSDVEKYVDQLEKASNIKDLIEAKEYKIAVKKADKVMKDDFLLSSIQKEITAMKKEAQSKLAKSEKKEKPVAQQTTPQTTTPAPAPKQETNNAPSEPVKINNSYATYMNKAAMVEATYTRAAYDIDGEAMDSYGPSLKAFNESHKQWDKLLNEIYGTLKANLSTSDFNALRDRQRQWIKERDHAAENAFNNPDGYADEIAYAESLSSTTSSRCYELLELYRNNL